MKVATNQERLIELFDADSRSDTAIADELHVSKQAISAWRKGTRSPKKPMLIRIAEIYNVSIEWLMGFDVDKLPAPRVENESKDNGYLPADVPQTPEARILAKGIDKLPQEQREQALNIIRAVFIKYADLFDKENDNET